MVAVQAQVQRDNSITSTPFPASGRAWLWHTRTRVCGTSPLSKLTVVNIPILERGARLGHNDQLVQ